MSWADAIDRSDAATRADNIDDDTMVDILVSVVRSLVS